MLAESSTTIAMVGKPVRRSVSVNSAIINTTIAIKESRSMTSTALARRPAAAPSRA